MILLRVASLWLDISTLLRMLHATGRSIIRPPYHHFSLSDPFVAQPTGGNDPLVVHRSMLGSYRVVGAFRTA